MDPTHFDTLTRALTKRTSEIPSRRSVLHALSGLLAAGALTVADADAKRKKKPKKCKGGKKKCGKKCIAKSACCPACGDGQTCQNGTCTTDCEPQCAGKECGPDGCGESCGSCSGDETCQDGSCVASIPCPPDQTRCGGQCVNLSSNPANCGACGNSCTSSQICLAADCCGPHGTVCTSDVQCCSALCDAIHEVKPTGQSCYLPTRSGRCCVDLLGDCSDACDCCGSLICLERRCCIANGQPCNNNGQCCSLHCADVGGTVKRCLQ